MPRQTTAAAIEPATVTLSVEELDARTFTRDELAAINEFMSRAQLQGTEALIFVTTQQKVQALLRRSGT